MKRLVIHTAVGVALLCYGGLPVDLYGQTFTEVTESGISTQTNVSTGASWGDYDKDGYLDLYVTNAPGTGNETDDRRDELYRNNGDGTFTRITEGALVQDRLYSSSSIWVDVDNDGRLDLYVSNIGPFDALRGTGPFPAPNGFYHNNGDGTFTKITTGGPSEGVNATWSSSWADYDKDGDLDVFAVDVLGTQNLFYRHDGNNTFTLIGPAPFNTTGRSARLVNWVDYDDDGDEDLFILNLGVTGINELYRNLLAETGSPAFEAITEIPLLDDVDITNAIGSSWVDYDNDGDLDVYMTTASGGSRNHLFRNEGAGRFERIRSGNVLATQGAAASGSCWGDYDNDGDLDVFVATDNSPSGEIPDQYFVNDGTGLFALVTEGALVEEMHFSKGCANGDYDNDGDLDLFVTHGDNRAVSAVSGVGIQMPVPEPNQLFRNEDGNQNNWINISLQGTTSNSFGVGARIFATATIGGEPRTQMRWIAGGPTGDRGQNSLRVHVGLGDAATIDALIIEWPSGQVDSLVNVVANQFLTISETPLPVANEDEPALPRHVTLHETYPNPFRTQTMIGYRLPQRVFVTLTVYDLLGRVIATLVRQDQPAGVHEVLFDAQAVALPSGIYVYRLQAGSIVETRTMVLRK